MNELKSQGLGSKLFRELKERYDFCNFFGHLDANSKTNLCSYCFRNLNYENNDPIEDIIRDFSRGLSSLDKELVEK